MFLRRKCFKLFLLINLHCLLELFAFLLVDEGYLPKCLVPAGFYRAVVLLYLLSQLAFTCQLPFVLRPRFKSLDIAAKWSSSIPVSKVVVQLLYTLADIEGVAAGTGAHMLASLIGNQLNDWSALFRV